MFTFYKTIINKVLFTVFTVEKNLQLQVCLLFI
jgi:hypothetical protein